MDLKHSPDGLQLKVTYTEFDSRYDEWLPANSHRVQEQFSPQMGVDQLKVNNRIDVWDAGKWREALVTDLRRDGWGRVAKVDIHFKGKNSKYDIQLGRWELAGRVKSVQEGYSKNKVN